MSPELLHTYNAEGRLVSTIELRPEPIVCVYNFDVPADLMAADEAIEPDATAPEDPPGKAE